jgi:hypothetical protein
MMTEARATIGTAHADQYLQQLCKHWSHRLAVESSPGRARITMPSGAIVLLHAESERLDVTIRAADAATLAETKEVVVRHLDRFAFREAPLPFDWSA